MARPLALGICSFALVASCWGDDGSPLLIRHPTANAERIAFSYAGEIWTVSRDGGDAQRLTSGVGSKTDPFFSPDGKWIAYTGNYYGNSGVFVIPATGGEPKRLTSHPNPDFVEG
jgi:tricorn protease